MTHLNALNTRLAHEIGRLANAKTDGERDMRKVWIAGIEKEIAAERAFLGLPAEEALPEMTDDELLAELFA